MGSGITSGDKDAQHDGFNGESVDTDRNQRAKSTLLSSFQGPGITTQPTNAPCDVDGVGIAGLTTGKDNIGNDSTAQSDPERHRQKFRNNVLVRTKYSSKSVKL